MKQSKLCFSRYCISRLIQKKKVLKWPLHSSTAECMHTVTSSSLINSALFPELLNSRLGYSMPLQGYNILIMDYNDINVTKYNADNRT